MPAIVVTLAIFLSPFFVYCHGIVCRLLCPFCRILSGFLLSVSFYELLPCRLPCWRVSPFGRASLHYLLPSVHSEIIPILPQHSSQLVYRNYQFYFHIKSVFCILYSVSVTVCILVELVRISFALRTSLYGHFRISSRRPFDRPPL